MIQKNGVSQGIPWIFRAPSAADIPSDKGAYALLIRIRRRFCAPVGALGMVDLPAGDYLYLGSARGPGGLRARIGRHLREGKTPHWHVDHLARRDGIAAVLALPGGSECALVAGALAFAGVSAPVGGFGSSDCRRCPAHLLAVAGGGGAAVLAALAGADAGSTG